MKKTGSANDGEHGLKESHYSGLLNPEKRRSPNRRRTLELWRLGGSETLLGTLGFRI